MSDAYRDVPKEFLVAFSFAGEQRELVKSVAKSLERRLGANSVFFDEWFEHLIAGDDADIRLQEIYSKRTKLVVPCVSGSYGSKPWTLAEHKAIRSLQMQLYLSTNRSDSNRILPLRVGPGDVPGIFENTICPDVRERPIASIVELILKRLELISPRNGTDAEDQSREADFGHQQNQATSIALSRVTLVIPGNINTFTQKDQEQLLFAINSLPGIKGGVTLFKVEAGSIRITITGTAEDIDVVISALKSNRLANANVAWGEFDGKRISPQSLDSISVETPSNAPRSTGDQATLPQIKQASLSPVSHVILLVYGIRDTGGWQQKAQQLLEDAATRVVSVKYDFYDAVSFVSYLSEPQAPYNALLEAYNSAISMYPNARISFVAHSFGTYLVHRLLTTNQAARFHRIILCGSVLKRDISWDELIDPLDPAHSNGFPILNECGDQDLWPFIAKTARRTRYGDAGRNGFENDVHVKSIWFSGGHGVFFSKRHIRENWIPFLNSLSIPKGDAIQPAPTFFERFCSTFPVGWLAFAAVTVLMLVRRFWWLVLLLMLLAFWVYPKPKPGGEVNVSFNVLLDRKTPQRIGPSIIRVLKPDTSEKLSELVQWEHEWKNSGPWPDEQLRLPCSGKYLLKCSISQSDKEVSPQRPLTLSLRKASLPGVPNLIYKKEVNVPKDGGLVAVDVMSTDWEGKLE